MLLFFKLYRYIIQKTFTYFIYFIFTVKTSLLYPPKIRTWPRPWAISYKDSASDPIQA